MRRNVLTNRFDKFDQSGVGVGLAEGEIDLFGLGEVILKMEAIEIRVRF